MHVHCLGSVCVANGTKVSIDVDGKRIFLEDDIKIDNGMRDCLSKHRASVAVSRMSCDALVVRDIARPGVRTLWVAILLGCPIVSCQTIIQGGCGPAVVFQSAITRRLAVYISDEFQRTTPVLAKLLRTALAKPHSAWRLLSHPPPMVKVIGNRICFNCRYETSPICSSRHGCNIP